MFQVITFYEFKRFSEGDLRDVKERLKVLMKRLGVKGTIILAKEGFNASLGGPPDSIEAFTIAAGSIFGAAIRPKSSFHPECPFRRVEVKIKPEIVTLRKVVDISAGAGSHVKPGDWNQIIEDPEVVLRGTITNSRRAHSAAPSIPAPRSSANCLRLSRKTSTPQRTRRSPCSAPAGSGARSLCRT